MDKIIVRLSGLHNGISYTGDGIITLTPVASFTKEVNPWLA